MKETLEAFERLNNIVKELRVKCPWDAGQTKESIRHLSIEEVYELSDTILQNDYPAMKEELGDLMLHLMFYSNMAEEQGEFDLKAVLESQSEKLIRRHPHVYGSDDPDLAALDTYEKVMGNWERIKARERKGAPKPKMTLDGVPESMPSLIKAYRMQQKAASVGFDWEQKDEVWAKVKEEMAEFEEATSKEAQMDEMGDLLFSLINYCRFLKINPEDALEQTNRKFKRRFEFVEQQAIASNREVAQLTLDEMEEFWKKAKALEPNS
ncbi:MAG: nucleoside triphosphate pyrophosphohydrolase [Bacteroidota bacterium]